MKPANPGPPAKMAAETEREREKCERLVSKVEGKTDFSRRLQAVRNRDCWVFGNHWRRE